MNKPTIGDFFDFCEKYPNETVNYRPKGTCSWRGSYNEACVLVEKNQQATLSDFIPFLNELTEGAEYEGYKGGTYTYEFDTDVNFELCDSSYSGDLSQFIEILASGDDLVTKFLENT
jgi:hypothetical protein